MYEEFYTARVDPGIADLIPDYLRNRRKEAETLGLLLAAGDFDQIAQMTHRMIGVGTPYGFPHITNLAKILRETALGKDTETLASLVKEYADYVEKVKVVFTKV